MEGQQFYWIAYLVRIGQATPVPNETVATVHPFEWINNKNKYAVENLAQQAISGTRRFQEQNLIRFVLSNYRLINQTEFELFKHLQTEYNAVYKTAKENTTKRTHK